jgi:outer membrane protein assembly factor BamB
MRHFIAPLIIALVHGHMADAQHITFERSYDYGYAEAAYAVIQTADGGYLMAGRQGFAPFYSEGLLIKTDAYGIEQWHNTFWAGCDTYIHDVKELEDGGFIIVGDHCRPSMASNIFLARTDEFGDTLWLKTFGTPDGDYARGVEILADGGFLIVGTWGIPPSKGTLIRTDDEGSVVWQQLYLPEGATESVFESLSVAEDGTFYMCGTAHFPDPTRENMLYAVRADAHGNLLWERWFGGPENDQGTAVATIPGGGVYAAGFTWSFGAGHYDMYLIRLTEDGDTLWTTTVGTANEETASQVMALADGGAVLAGTAYAGTPPQGQYQYMLSRIGDDGELLWSEQFGRPDQHSMYNYGACLADDGGHVICGASHFEAHLIKTDPQGRIVGIDDPVTGSEAPLLYPNPATDVCHLRFPPSWAAASMASTDIVNMVGATVLSTTVPTLSGSISLAVGHLSPGLYTVRLRTSQQQFANLKLIVR